ncbi:MAG: AMP-binding protein, partial [Pseudomonadota bacterium]
MANELYDALFAPHARSEAVFIHTTDGQKITFKEFVTLAGRVANALFESELRQGDRIALQVEKSVEALAVYAACVQSGLVFLPLNIAYTPAEVEYFLEDSGARAFICDPGKLNFFESVAQAFGITLSTLGKEGEGSLMAKTRQFSGNFETVDADTGSLAAILYTSGTTGRSKGAMLTQGNLLSNARVLTDYWCFERSDRLLHALPIFHTHGLFVAVNVCLLSGASIIWMSRFDVDTVKKHLLEATTMMGVPT